MPMCLCQDIYDLADKPGRGNFNTRVTTLCCAKRYKKAKLDSLLPRNRDGWAVAKIS